MSTCQLNFPYIDEYQKNEIKKKERGYNSFITEVTIEISNTWKLSIVGTYSKNKTKDILGITQHLTLCRIYIVTLD